MNPGSIWWNQIGNSLRFVEKVTDHLRYHTSVILHLPAQLPWPEHFREAVDRRRAGFCASRSLRRIAWEPGAEPGALVLEELCSPAVRAGYWPGETVSAYLAAREELMLNEYYVWVGGIHRKADLSRWAEFVADYDRACGGRQNRAVFILEYDGTEEPRTGLETIRCRVEEYDCRVFCLELAAALENSSLRSYQAELALALGCGDPVLCAALLEQGEKLLLDPAATALEVTGQSGPEAEKAVMSRAWRAAIVLLFPVLEKFRVGFIEAYSPQLLAALPVQGANGEAITDPRDLEIGTLYHIASCRLRELSREESGMLRLCRRVRNLLAHNKAVPFGDVRQLLSWDASH